MHLVHGIDFPLEQSRLKVLAPLLLLLGNEEVSAHVHAEPFLDISNAYFIEIGSDIDWI